MRYFFDVKLGNQIHRDVEGKEFADLSEARRHAIACGQQCFLGDNPLSLETLRNVSIEVTDRQSVSHVVFYRDMAVPLAAREINPSAHAA